MHQTYAFFVVMGLVALTAGVHMAIKPEPRTVRLAHRMAWVAVYLFTADVIFGMIVSANLSPDLTLMRIISIVVTWIFIITACLCLTTALLSVGLLLRPDQRRDGAQLMLLSLSPIAIYVVARLARYLFSLFG